MSGESKTREQPKEFEDAKEAYGDSWVMKKLVSMATKSMIKHKLGKEYLKPGFQVGLLEGAILYNPLAQPSEDGNWIELASAQPGRWRAYDFKRPEVFPVESQYEHFKLCSEGRLGAFVLEHLEDREEEELTPIGEINLLNLDHLFQMGFYSAEELVDLGLIRSTTNQEAYRVVGLYERYAKELEARGVIDDQVYQVTPKGNTIVILFPEMGSRRPGREKDVVTELVPALRHA